MAVDAIEGEPDLHGATAEQVRLSACVLQTFRRLMRRDRDPAHGESYVVAVDAVNDQYEQGTCEGTMKIHADYFLTGFLLLSIKDNALLMRELPGSHVRDLVWSGLFQKGHC